MKKLNLILLYIICLSAMLSINAAPGDSDLTFGRIGFSTAQLDADFDRAIGVTRQTDGKIIVVGNQSGSNSGTVTIIRFNANGSLDTTFSGDGIVTDGFGLVNAVALQPDGKIVVTGRIADINATLFSVTRYNTDGSLDTTFSGDGRFTDTADIVGNAIAVEPDGKIVVAGTGRNAVSAYAFAAVRLNSDGSLDTTFDGDGKVFTQITKFNERDDFVTALAVQSDGKVVVGGHSYFTDTARDFTLIRYNPDGSLDSTFGGNGKVHTTFENGLQDDILQSLAIDQNGRIVAAGYATNAPPYLAFALARYNPDGTLDTTFDGDGKVITQTRAISFERIYAVAVQSDGKIVAAGSSGYFITDFTLLRYNTDGSLDTTFGRGGIVYTTPSEQYNSGLLAVTLAPNGDIIAAGFVGKNSGSAAFAFARYNLLGMPDGTLGTPGYVTNNYFNQPTQSTEAVDVAVQTDGKIVVVGNRTISPTTTIGLLERYNTDGSIDRDFGGANYRGLIDVNIPQPGTHQVSAVAIQPDGKILVLVSYDGDSDAGFYVMRFNSDGQKDLSFGGNNAGYAYLSVFDGGGLGRDLILTTDGKIIVAGASANLFTQTFKFAVFKFNNDGSRDTNFGANGIAVTSLSSGNDVAFSVVAQADGKIVAAGSSNYDENKDGSAALVRFNANGSIDNSFGSGGRAVIGVGAFADTISSVGLQSDGKIVGGGVSCRDGGCTGGTGVLFRFNANGSFDSTFDSDGTVFVQSSSPELSTAISSIVIQSSGKILIGGITANTATGDDALVARYNIDGTLDASFGTNGMVSSDIGKTEQFSNSIALQPDGKIVSVGSSAIGTRTDFAIWRYSGNSVKSRQRVKFF